MGNKDAGKKTTAIEMKNRVAEHDRPAQIGRGTKNRKGDEETREQSDRDTRTR